MKANELTLGLLKASKTISLENGNVLEFIKSSTYNETAYNSAIARGEDIVLFKTSVSDNKARAIVSVNGVESSYPLYINEIKKFAETGIAPKNKDNFFEVGTTTKEPRKMSEETAKKHNLQPLANYKSSNAFDTCFASAKRFAELEKELNELRAKYHFANNTAPLANAALSLPHYKEYSLRIERIKAVCARYKAMQCNYIEHLQKAVEKSQNTQKGWLADNWLELTKKAGQQKAAELQKVVDTARAELQKAECKVYLTDADIYKRYGIEL